jgi:hypothetical protein
MKVLKYFETLTGFISKENPTVGKYPFKTGDMIQLNRDKSGGVPGLDGVYNLGYVSKAAKVFGDRQTLEIEMRDDIYVGIVREDGSYTFLKKDKETMLRINLACTVEIPIDLDTLKLYFAVEGYNIDDERSMNTISFRLPENKFHETEELARSWNEKLKEFNAEPSLETIYSREANDYDKDKRPVVVIKFPSGWAGIRNSPSFSIVKS